MTEAVIVATARSPIGRANKGSLTELRPDDMSAQIVSALMASATVQGANRRPELGIGQPQAGGFNSPRGVRARGFDDVPASPSPLLLVQWTIRMAFHQSRPRGRRLNIGRRRDGQPYASGASDIAPNASFKNPARHKQRARADRAPGPAGGHARHSRHGQTAENVVGRKRDSREMDAFAFARRTRAFRDNGFFDLGRSRRYAADGTVAQGHGPRPGRTTSGSQLKTVFRPDGPITAQRVPMNDVQPPSWS